MAGASTPCAGAVGHSRARPAVPFRRERYDKASTPKRLLLAAGAGPSLLVASASASQRVRFHRAVGAAGVALIATASAFAVVEAGPTVLTRVITLSPRAGAIISDRDDWKCSITVSIRGLAIERVPPPEQRAVGHHPCCAFTRRTRRSTCASPRRGVIAGPASGHSPALRVCSAAGRCLEPCAPASAQAGRGALYRASGCQPPLGDCREALRSPGLFVLPSPQSGHPARGA